MINEILPLIHGEENVFSLDDKHIYLAGLLKLIDTHLIERHDKIRTHTNTGQGFNEQRLSLGFKSLYGVLSSSFRNHNEQYWELFCRKNFEEAYTSYIDNCHRNISLCRRVNENKSAIVNIEKYREDVLASYLNYNCIEIMRIVFPHEVYNGNDQRFYVAISTIQGIKDVFLKFIEALATKNKTLYFQCIKAKRYHPSCVDFRADEEWERTDKLELFKNNMIINEEYYKSAFIDVDYLVVNASLEQNIDYESVHLETITEGISQSDIEDDKYNIITSHSLELMHYKTAVEILGNE